MHNWSQLEICTGMCFFVYPAWEVIIFGCTSQQHCVMNLVESNFQNVNKPPWLSSFSYLGLLHVNKHGLLFEFCIWQLACPHIKEKKRCKNFLCCCIPRIPVPMHIFSLNQMLCEHFWQASLKKTNSLPPIYFCICIHLKHMICSVQIIYSYPVTTLIYTHQPVCVSLQKLLPHLPLVGRCIH